MRVKFRAGQWFLDKVHFAFSKLYRFWILFNVVFDGLDDRGLGPFGVG